MPQFKKNNIYHATFIYWGIKCIISVNNEQI